MISLEYVLATLITITLGLIAVIWKSNNGHIAAVSAAAKKGDDKLWAEVNKLKDGEAGLREMRGSLTTEIINIKLRMDSLPTYKDMCDKLAEIDTKLERRLDVILAQDLKLEAVITLLAKGSDRRAV
jgi:hypothetical protein